MKYYFMMQYLHSFALLHKMDITILFCPNMIFGYVIYVLEIARMNFIYRIVMHVDYLHNKQRYIVDFIVHLILATLRNYYSSYILYN
jgi:hypothetical protein